MRTWLTILVIATALAASTTPALAQRRGQGTSGEIQRLMKGNKKEEPKKEQASDTAEATKSQPTTEDRPRASD